MRSTVNIPFRTFMEVGFDTFKVNVPRRFLKNQSEELEFGFSRLSLIPEFYSQQAFENKLDAPGQADWETEYPLQLVYSFSSSYLGSEKAYVPSIDNIETYKLVEEINTHFYNVKPEGAQFPALIIDWYIEGWDSGEDKTVTFKQYHEKAAPAMYKEKFSLATHSNALPFQLRKMSFNTLKFPTTDDPEMLKMVRVRINIANSTELGFKNKNLLLHLGLDEERIPPRSARNQITIPNPYPKTWVSIKSDNPPEYMLKEALKSKITCYPNERRLVSDQMVLKTTRAQEQIVGKLAQLVDPYLKTMSDSFYLVTGMEFDQNTKTYRFAASRAPGIRTTLKCPAKLAKLMGFELTSEITEDMVADPVGKTFSIEESERLARTAVYDIGMVVVNLEQQCSLQTSQFVNTMMATLEPNYAGTMSTWPTSEMPTVKVTYFSPTLEFKMHRFSEQNIPIPLGLQVGAYIQGVLVGKSINRNGEA